jgi:hypothetical protein
MVEANRNVAGPARQEHDHVAAGLERLHHPALVESVHPDLHLQELPQPVVAFRQMVALVPGEEEDRFVPPPLVQVQGLLLDVGEDGRAVGLPVGHEAAEGGDGLLGDTHDGLVAPGTPLPADDIDAAGELLGLVGVPRLERLPHEFGQKVEAASTPSRASSRARASTPARASTAFCASTPASPFAPSPRTGPTPDRPVPRLGGGCR